MRVYLREVLLNRSFDKFIFWELKNNEIQFLSAQQPDASWTPIDIETNKKLYVTNHVYKIPVKQLVRLDLIPKVYEGDAKTFTIGFLENDIGSRTTGDFIGVLAGISLPAALLSAGTTTVITAALSISALLLKANKDDLALSPGPVQIPALHTLKETDSDFIYNPNEKAYTFEIETEAMHFKFIIIDEVIAL